MSLRRSPSSSPTAEAAAGRPVILLRPAPQVARAWGKYDALLYNLMTMNLAVMFSIPILAAAAFYPRGSLPVAIVVAGVFCCAEAAVYAFLASSMPRSGGDYHFQRRLVSGSVASVFAFTGVVLGGAVWMAIAGWFAADVAVGPALVIGGELLGSPALVGLGRFAQSDTGAFALSILVIAWSSLVNIWGMRVYAGLQRVFWVAGSAALIAAVVLAVAFRSRVSGDSALFDIAIQRAAVIGYEPAHGGALIASTIALVPFAAFSLIYPAWSVQQAGEVREARSLRSQMLTIFLAEAITVVLSAVVVAVAMSWLGRSGLAAGSYLFFTDHDALPFPTVPFFWFFDGLLWPAGVIALCLVVLFNAWFWMWVPDITLAASRVMLAMSTDRALPRWLGDTARRNGAPVKAVLVFAAGCLVPAFLFAYTDVWRLTLAVTLLNVVAFAVTCAAAAAMPFMRRELYRESTAAPYEVLHLPLVTLCGAAFVAFTAFLVWRFAVDDALALGGGWQSRFIFVVALYLGSLALLYGFRRYRRRREGAEIEIMYRRVDDD